MGEPGSLAQQSGRFAENLTNLVLAVIPDVSPFVARSVGDGSRFIVTQNTSRGIVLRVSSRPILSLVVEYNCCLDGQQTFLAIEKSYIKVFAGQKVSSEPLFRYEYERQANQIPAAHIQVHAHRDAFTASMVRAGKATKRGSRRASDTNVPAMSELHFPVGGHRFRPSLEDILEMLIDEFGIDHHRGARSALQAGCEAWRRIQTRVAVRDDPESAIDALKALGHEVQLRPGEPVPMVRTDRLRQI